MFPAPLSPSATPAILAVPQLDLFLLAALALLVAGVVGSLLPVVPGAILSLSGVYLYWYSTAWTDPGLTVVVIATALGLLAIVVDLFGGIISASASGVTTKTAVVAGLVGFLLLPLLGPLGVVVGITATVAYSEYRKGTPLAETLRTTLTTVAGILLANLLQFVLTSLILLGFLGALLL